MRQPEDPRKSRTKVLLRDALISLLDEKPLSTITVKELVGRANVTRSTFYLHYYDKDDFVEKVCDEMLAGFAERAAEFDRLPYRESILKRGITFFEYISNNADFYKAMLGPNGTPSFRTKIERMGLDYFLNRYCPPLLANIDKDRSDRLKINIEVLAHYVVSAKIGVVEHWLSTGMNLSPKFLAETTSSYVHALIKQNCDITD